MARNICVCVLASGNMVIFSEERARDLAQLDAMVENVAVLIEDDWYFYCVFVVVVVDCGCIEDESVSVVGIVTVLCI